MNAGAPVRAISWMVAEPARLARDRREVESRFNNLVFEEQPDDLAPHGSWRGHIPVWPFERSEPDGLQEVVPTPLEVVIAYPSAYPMLAPRFIPRQPAPSFDERSQHRWHVAPNGQLCLLQSEALWSPDSSIVDLIEKAAGWRIEYALVKAGVLESMSLHGIALDGSFDHLITEMAASEKDGSAAGAA